MLVPKRIGPLGFISKEGRCHLLVLSRKVSERILVGDKVVVTVVRIGPHAVRLGIEAPKDMNIVREELVDPDAPPHPIHAGPEQVDGLGVRVIDPLGVADAYEQLSEAHERAVEKELIEHGC